MKSKVLVIVIHCFMTSYSRLNYSYNCGIDKSSATVVYEGMADIETYPWLGVLFYPINHKPVTTTVILITKQLVLGAALDIDRYPKIDFRARAKIVLGHNCSGPRIGIRDYTYHPDYAENTYSALTIIQLETRFLQIELRPICPPAMFFEDYQVYAMTLSHKCGPSMVRIYKMKHVKPEECRQYYRKFDLDMESMWPRHFACAKALNGAHCVWNNGASLVIRQNDRWKLIGFGVSGPGCEAPARFLDYGMYYHWVRNNIARIGRPAITRTARNRLIVRRTLASVQRFGECDPEESRVEIYSDTTAIRHKHKYAGELKYNMTLLANVEYNCVILEVTNNTNTTHQPIINLYRWWGPHPMSCQDHYMIKVDFYLHIKYYGPVTYRIRAYGQELKLIDGKKTMAYANKRKKYPKIFGYDRGYKYSANKFVAG